MKKILGLDLGVASIGWAMIESASEAAQTDKIVGMGVRVVPLNSDETDEFTKGQPVTTNQVRRMSRGLRRGYYRFRLRKTSLLRALKEMNAMPSQALLTELNNLETYALRARAANEALSLAEFGRVLFHINQKRGYKSNRKTDVDEGGKKVSEYLQAIRQNQEKVAEQGQTIGQFFHAKLLQDPQYRIKGQVFPRAAYLAEFDKIWACQAAHHPEELTEKRRKRLRDEIIFFQRRLKSAKGLVGKCSLEPLHRVTPKSSPLHQYAKVLEALNAVTFFDREGQKGRLSAEQKALLLPRLMQESKLSWSDACKIIQLKKADYTPDLKTGKTGLEGNTTIDTLRKAFEKAGIERPELLELDWAMRERTDPNRVDENTGELRREVAPEIEQQAMYQLWHAIYSIEEDEDLQSKLMQKFNFSAAQAAVLSRIDFTRQGYGARCARALRRLIPYLEAGLVYSDAATMAGYRHSESLTIEENLARELVDQLKPIAKNELRSPIVEKILNQLIHLVNALIADPRYGRPDEIRIEFGRELQQTADQRSNAYNRNNQRDVEAKKIREELEGYGVKANRKNIEKYRLYFATNGMSPYSGERIELSAYLHGENADIDHIIPQSRLFDDSFGNKTISEISHNRAKGNQTAFEYMHSLGEAAFEQYKARINQWYKDGMINQRKRDYFLMPGEEIPNDFIERDMRLTSFISKEAKRRLEPICYHVTNSSGTVTALLRRCWGWDNTLKQLNFSMYEAAGLTEVVEMRGGKKESRIRSAFWTKRDDHRHHAIDALVVACTRQGFIQRLNTLNGQEGGTSKDSLEKYFADQEPFTLNQVKAEVESILVSFNSRKRVVTRSVNRANGQSQVTQSPRGALSESTVYGKIQVHDKQMLKLAPSLSLDVAQKIAPRKIRRLVLDRLLENGNDPAKAFKAYKNNPIYLDAAQTEALWSVEIPILREEYVVKYKLDANFKAKDVEFIIDPNIKKLVAARLAAHGGKEREAFRDLEHNPIWLNEAKGVAVKSVRCFTGLRKVVAVSKDARGKEIGFVKPGNNHHIAIYRDAEGNLQENAVTFWDAVKRRSYGLPVVIREPGSAWDHLLHKVAAGLSDESFQALEAQLPAAGWEYVVSLNMNEMFVFGMEALELDAAILARDYRAVAPFLYRVQKLASKDYVFRRHLETRVDDKFGGEKNSPLAVSLGKVIRIKSLSPLMKGIKVVIDRLGQITSASIRK